MTSVVKNQISIKQLINDLNSGLTRYKKDDFGNGSIEEKYNLSKSQIMRIFKHDKLKGLKVKGKTRLKDNIDLIDDTNPENLIMELEGSETVMTNTNVEELELLQTNQKQ